MKGRRLKVAPVGEIRRRWASMGVHEISKFSVLAHGVTEDVDEGEWSSSDQSSRGIGDPMHGLRPRGSRSRFWDDDEFISPPATPRSPSLPSTSSLGRRAREAGFLQLDIDDATKALQDPRQQLKILSSSDGSLDRSNHRIKEIVTTLFERRKPPCGVWHGPLPPERTSPAMDLGSCPIKDLRGKGEARRRREIHRPPEKDGGFRISNNQTSSSLGRTGHGSRNKIWVKDGPSWIRVGLKSDVGKFLSRKGSLPLEYRIIAATTATLAADRPSYAAVLRGSAMDQSGRRGSGVQRGGFQGGFNGGRQGGNGAAFQGQFQGDGRPHSGQHSGHQGAFQGGNFGGDGAGGFGQHSSLQGGNFGNFQDANTGGFHGQNQAGMGWNFGAPANNFQGGAIANTSGEAWNGYNTQQGQHQNGSGFMLQNQGSFVHGGSGGFTSNNADGVLAHGRGTGAAFGANQFNTMQGTGTGLGSNENEHGFNPGYGSGRAARGGFRQRGRGRDTGRGRFNGGRAQQQIGAGGGRGQQQVPYGGNRPQTFNNLQPATQQPQQPTQEKNVQVVMPEPAVVPVKTSGQGSSEEKQVGAEEKTQQQVHGGVPMDIEGDAAKGKEKDKWCFRCRTRGHLAAECIAQLFCQVCESDEHVAAKCPIKKRPRPVAHAVGYAVDNLGFCHIPHAPYATTKKDGITALVKVIGGKLTEEELVGHLKRLVPGNFNWDVQLHAPDTWVAPFPSKNELKRTINFGSADLKNGLSLKFEEFEEEEYFGYELPTVWMRVLNLPKVLRTYEVLWAIGTMFGATQRVDMITTRKNSFGRFKVAVLNPKEVPTEMDVVIGTRFFELKFAIEPLEIAQGEANKPTAPKDDGDDEPQGKKDEEMEEKNKKPKHTPDGSLGKNDNVQDSGASASGGPVADGEIENWEDEDDLLDDVGGAKNDHIEEEYAAALAPHNRKIQEEKKVIGGSQIVQPDAAQDMTTKPFDCDMADHGSLVMQPSSQSKLTVPSVAHGPMSDKVTKELKEHCEGKENMEDVVSTSLESATPPTRVHAEMNATPLRRSKRREESVDEDSIQRAARLTAVRNLEIPGGYIQSDVLDSLLGYAAKTGRPTPNLMGVSCP
ncbi:unnamed protein product [Urochloa decumbens]|uniref:CCHC-type domain-containing protein n=1 Tax=Urochloa decumbens TaxID=240449 RepID=A0ABC9BYY1_9POAL